MDNQPSIPTRVSVNFSPIVITILVLAVGFYFLYHFGKSSGGARPSKWEYAIFGVMEPRSDSPTAILLPNKGPTELQSYDFPEDLTSNSWDMADLLNIMGNKGWQLCGTEREQQEHGDISTDVVTFYFKRPKQ